MAAAAELSVPKPHSFPIQPLTHLLDLPTVWTLVPSEGAGTGPWEPVVACGSQSEKPFCICLTDCTQSRPLYWNRSECKLLKELLAALSSSSPYKMEQRAGSWFQCLPSAWCHPTRHLGAVLAGRTRAVAPRGTRMLPGSVHINNALSAHVPAGFCPSWHSYHSSLPSASPPHHCSGQAVAELAPRGRDLSWDH